MGYGYIEIANCSILYNFTDLIFIIKYPNWLVLLNGCNWNLGLWIPIAIFKRQITITKAIKYQFLIILIGWIVPEILYNM